MSAFVDGHLLRLAEDTVRADTHRRPAPLGCAGRRSCTRPQLQNSAWAFNAATGASPLPYLVAQTTTPISASTHVESSP